MTAIAYDWIDSAGGAERILRHVLQAFPNAPIHTLFINRKTAPWIASYDAVNVSFLQPLYRALGTKRPLTPLMPYAVERMRVEAPLLSFSSSFVKGLKAPSHVSYLFGPTRWLWYEQERYMHHVPTALLRSLQQWDYRAAQRPGKILTLSRFSAQRIKEIYGRSATVITPPFDMPYFSKLKKRAQKVKVPPSFFLFVGRLEPYKNVHVLLDAFRELPSHLVIVGTGSQEKKLRENAGERVHFLGQISDDKLAYVYQKATALLMPQSEDYGYTAVESLFFNTPVLSYRHSGTAEVGARCGGMKYVKTQSPPEWAQAIADFHISSYNYDRKVFDTMSPEQFIVVLKKHLY